LKGGGLNTGASVVHHMNVVAQGREVIPQEPAEFAVVIHQEDPWGTRVSTGRLGKRLHDGTILFPPVGRAMTFTRP
jgi:hypothetical protein